MKKALLFIPLAAAFTYPTSSESEEYYFAHDIQTQYIELYVSSSFDMDSINFYFEDGSIDIRDYGTYYQIQFAYWDTLD